MRPPALIVNDGTSRAFLSDGMPGTGGLFVPEMHHFPSSGRSRRFSSGVPSRMTRPWGSTTVPDQDSQTLLMREHDLTRDASGRLARKS